MSRLEKDKFEINLLTTSYLRSKIKLEDHENRAVQICPYRLKNYRRTVKHIEDVARVLPDKQRLIIENEVMMGRGGTWYLEYFSAASYFRHRAKAYAAFLDCL